MKTVLKALKRENFAKEILSSALLLRSKDQQQLFELAREKRKIYFPSKEVEARSVIELSNICQQKCKFCSINLYSKKQRYLIKFPEFMSIVDHIYLRGRQVLLIQSGENKSQNYIHYVCRCIKSIKKKYKDLVIILCLGNLSYAQYRALKDAGAERYILKFETSNPKLYKKIKPTDSLKQRINSLKWLIKLGFEVGTGVMVGLPGQTIDDLAKDLLYIRKLKVMMASCSVFIPGKNSYYQNEAPGDLDTTLNFMALMRIMYPQLLIPSTSSLEWVKKGGQFKGLMAGANTITVHDGTPSSLKKCFPIYSSDRFTPNGKYMRTIVSKAGLRFSKSALFSKSI